MLVVITLLIVFSLIASLVFVFVLAKGNTSPIQKGIEAFSNNNWNAVLKYLVPEAHQDAQDPIPFFYVALAYKQKKQYDKAIASLRQIEDRSLVNKDISEKSLYSELADIYLKKNDHTNAIRYNLLYLEVDKTSALPLYQLGNVYFEIENYNKAVDYLKKALMMNRDLTDCFAMIGISLYHLKDTEEAMSYLSAATKIKDSHKSTFYYLGILHFQSNDFTEAEKYLTKSVELDKHTIICNQTLGDMKKNSGDLAGCIPFYEKAIASLELKPEDLNEVNHQKYNLADICYKVGKSNQANKLWGEIAQIDPTFKDVSEKVKNYSLIEKETSLVSLSSMSYMDFQILVKKILQAKKHTVEKVEKINNGQIKILSSYIEKNSKADCLSVFNRTMSTVGDLELRTLSQEIRDERVYKGMYFTLTEFSKSAHEFSMSTSIDLIEGKAFAKMINATK